MSCVYVTVAQQVEQWTENPCRVSSILTCDTIIFYIPANPGVPYKELRVAKNREQIAEGYKRYNCDQTSKRSEKQFKY